MKVVNGRFVDATKKKPPCSRCAATRKIIKRVASRIRDVIRGK